MRLIHVMPTIAFSLVFHCVVTTQRATAADPPKPAAATTFAEGQKVEVREGDAWSKATVVKREGRRYFIHYEGADAAADEWVTTDRIRLPGTTDPTKADTELKPGLGAARKPTTWNLHQAVEVKWGGSYRKASITNKRGEWYLISYSDYGRESEWVEPWRIRKVGSTDDPIGYAPPNGFVRKGGDPPRPTPGPPPDAAGKPDEAKQAEEAATVPVTPNDRVGMREIVLGGGAVEFQALPPDTELKPAKPLAPASIVLKGWSGEIFDRTTGVYIAPAASLAAVVHTDSRSHNVRAERIDLAAGTSVNVAQIPVADSGLDLSPDGKLLLAQTNVLGVGAGNNARLDVWQIDAAGPAKQLSSFVPYDDRQPNDRDVQWARFVDADHILAMGSGGNFSLWEFRKAKEIWRSTLAYASKPTLSSNGKYLAVTARGQVVLAEVLAGTPLGHLSCDWDGPLNLAFSADGRQLAGAWFDMLYVWNLSTGELTHDVASVGAQGNSVYWMGNDYVMLDHQWLVSLDKKLIIWSYKTGWGVTDHDAKSFAGRFWYAAQTRNARKQGPVLASAILPDSQARAAAATVKPDDQMALRPGLRVSLEVNASGDAREKIVQALTARLKQNGVTVADNQPLKFVAKIEQGKPREASFRPFGQGPWAAQKVTITDSKSTLVLQDAGGKVLWQRVGINTPPPILMTKQGQTAQDAINDATKPSMAFFEKARIPVYVPKSPEGLGTSELTAMGVQSKL